MPEGQRRLAAIMFTDMVGYTALGQRNESLSLSLVDQQRKLVRPLLAQFNGREVKTMGDAFLVEFPNALDAVKCAYEIQKANRNRNELLPADERIHLRVGVHLGDVVESEGDIFGDAVNVASRIESVAEDGGVCLTRQVYDHVHNKLGFPLARLGSRQLKNVASPVEVYQVVTPWGGERVVSPSMLDRRRIAVLPFANISPDPSDEYFADGMTEELIATLSNIRSLSVISRTSVLHYKGGSKRVEEISKELNAGVLLEGSVRKSGNKVRITVQLIDALDDRHMWSEKYDRELTDIFAVQGEIAQQVALALQAELLTSDKIRIERGSTNSAGALISYLKGRYHMNRTAWEELRKGINFFEGAIEEDSNYAPAYAALSETYTYLAGDAIPEKEAFPKARQYALRAIELDERLAEGHTSLGILGLQYDWNWGEADRELRRAIELNPSYSTAHQWYGILLSLTKKLEDGIPELVLAESLDPLHPLIKINLGFIYYKIGLYEKARRKLEDAIDLQEGVEYAHYGLGLISIQESRFDEAITQLKKVAYVHEAPAILGALGYAQAAAGHSQEAREVLEKLASARRPGFDSPTSRAVVHLGLGEVDQALDLLEEASQQRESWLVMTRGDHYYDSIKSNPRYVALLHSLGLPP